MGKSKRPRDRIEERPGHDPQWGRFREGAALPCIALPSQEDDEAHAQHSKKCWKACVDMSDPEEDVLEMVGALRQCALMLERAGGSQDTVDRALAAITRATAGRV